MGWWRTARGIGGDEWADEMGRCNHALQKITVVDSKLYGAEEHEITMQEFADLVEFCSRGHIVADVRFPERDGARPLSQLHGNAEVETYSNRGQIHCADVCPMEEEKAVQK